MAQLPLRGLIVLEFSQYLSGPSAGLRLADLGARVIKIERPKGGDAGRKLAIKNLWLDDNSLLFHTINRNKESFAADLKSPDDLALVKRLIQNADVLIHNFRPGVMDKIGLDYSSVLELNQRMIYAEITGYGRKGPWKDKPGQDLLLQAMSGLAYTTGNRKDNPVPFGLSIADTLCGAQLVQGILAALIRRHKTGKGAIVEISLLESLLDFQFELLTTYYASGKQPLRGEKRNAHPLLSAPYGVYFTKDGFIAIAMVPLAKLNTALKCKGLEIFSQDEAFSKRDEIKELLAEHLIQNDSSFWIKALHQFDLWAIKVMTWTELTDHPAYQCLQMEQTISIGKKKMITTRCPIRINGERLFSDTAAPQLGEHTEKIKREFNLQSVLNKIA